MAASQFLDMPDPLVKGELFQEDALVQHTSLGSRDDAVPHLRVYRLEQDLAKTDYVSVHAPGS